jgi:hypothetical protein
MAVTIRLFAFRELMEALRQPPGNPQVVALSLIAPGDDSSSAWLPE